MTTIKETIVPVVLIALVLGGGVWYKINPIFTAIESLDCTAVKQESLR